MNLQNKPLRKIHLLPEHIVDQIKAGEVVERPSALLKELIENAIDAKSDRIDIQIKDNGIELISIEDNGEGMDVEDLPYAFCRHATSKINKFDDLYGLHSYGFRGEALASISSVSRVTCTSSPKSDPSRGGKIVYFGGKQKDWGPISSSTHGTSFFVKDLFYNTPARLRFLKSKTSEKNALMRVFNAFLLTSPEVAFSLKWDEKEKVLFPKCPKENILNRVARVFFKKRPTEETLSQIKEVSSEYDGVKLRGFYSKTTTKGASGKAQYFFVNGRMFVDKALHLAFMRAAENTWPKGEYGHYCFFIDLPPDQIDVNVHPGKIHIKFLRPSVVFGLVSNSIEKVKVESESPQNSSTLPISIDDLWSTYSGEHLKGDLLQGTRNGHNERQGQQFFSLNKNFIILRNDFSTALLIDLNKLIKSLLRDLFVNNTDTTPLLIGEALLFKKGAIDKKITPLRDFGFDLDRVDEETLILRTVPSLLTSFSLQELMSLILKGLDSSKQLDIDRLLSLIEPDLHTCLRPIRLEALYKKLKSMNFVLSDSTRELNDHLLESLLTEES